MDVPELKDFSLVGGTALALQFGHRLSIDLDLFTNKPFFYYEIVNALKTVFGTAFEFEEKESDFGIFCFINSIKVDIINYRHAQIAETVSEGLIRMYSPEDIAAMKIQAILGRGKKKDFWDIAELLDYFSLQEIIAFHQKKFPSQHLLISIPQALVYFDEADESEDPVSLKGQTWGSVKYKIQKKVADFLK